MNTKKIAINKSINRIILLIFFTLGITFCLFQFFQKLSIYFVPDVKVQIVVSAREDSTLNKGTEVWLAETKNAQKYYELKKIINEESTGKWLYEDIQEYKEHAYNFVVSTGDNLGSTIVIPGKKVSDFTIDFLKSTSSGVVQIIVGDKVQKIDLYSNSPGGEILSIPIFPDSISSKYIESMIYIILFMLIFCLVWKLDSVINCKIVEKDETNITHRVYGLDLVRTIAVFFVPSVHFFLGSGYYNSLLIGKKLFFMTNMRWLFLTCVPIFMVLTGYLKKNKKVDKVHYKKVFSIIGSYVFITIITLIVNVLYHKNAITITSGISSIIHFQYSWYVNMYIGLFLLIPFLNIVYNNLKIKNHKEILILIMLFITSLATVTSNVISNYWVPLYPLTYYFIGAYLNEYEIKMNKIINVMLIIFVVFLESFGTYFHSWKGVFDWAFLGEYSCGYNSLPTIVLTGLIFNLLKDVNIKNKLTCKLTKNISALSLEIYLFSIISDSIIYPYFQRFLLDVGSFLPYFIIIVPASFISSWIMANIKNILFNYIKFLVKKFINRQSSNNCLRL